MSTVYDGEFIEAESGEERPFAGRDGRDIMSMVRRMKDGDALVVNAREEME